MNEEIDKKTPTDKDHKNHVEKLGIGLAELKNDIKDGQQTTDRRLSILDIFAENQIVAIRALVSETEIAVKSITKRIAQVERDFGVLRKRYPADKAEPLPSRRDGF